MKKKPTPKRPFNPLSNIWIILILSLLIFQLYYYITLTGETQTLSYNQFKSKIEQNIIKEIWIDHDQVMGSVKVGIDQKPQYLKTILPPFDDQTLLALLKKNRVDIHVKSQKESNFWIMLILLLPLFFFLGLILYGSRRIKEQLGGMGGGAFDFMHTSAKKNDLKEATKLATQMVSQWGMSKALGPVYYQKGEEHVFLGREMAMAKDFSEATAKLIDDEVRKIIITKEQEITKLLEEHQNKIVALSDKHEESL